MKSASVSFSWHLSIEENIIAQYGKHIIPQFKGE